MKRGDAATILASLSSSLTQFQQMSHDDATVLGKQWLDRAKQEIQSVQGLISEGRLAQLDSSLNNTASWMELEPIKTHDGKTSMFSGKTLFLDTPLSSPSSTPLLSLTSFPLSLAALSQADGSTLTYYNPTHRVYSTNGDAKDGGHGGASGMNDKESVSCRVGSLSLLSPHVGVHSIVHTGSQPVFKSSSKTDSTMSDTNTGLDVDYYPHIIIEPPVLVTPTTIRALSAAYQDFPNLHNPNCGTTPHSHSRTQVEETKDFDFEKCVANPGNYVSSLLHPQYRGQHLAAPASSLNTQIQQECNALYAQNSKNELIPATLSFKLSEIGSILPESLKYLTPSPNSRFYDHSALQALLSLASSGKNIESGEKLFPESFLSRHDYSFLAPAVRALHSLHSDKTATEAHTTPSTMPILPKNPTLSENIFLKYFPTLFGFPLATYTVSCSDDVKLVQRLATYDTHPPLPSSSSSLSSSSSSPSVSSSPPLLTALSQLRSSLLVSCLILSLFGAVEATLAAHALPANAAADLLKSAVLHAATLQPMPAARGEAHRSLGSESSLHSNSNGGLPSHGLSSASSAPAPLSGNGLRDAVNQLHAAHVQAPARVSEHERGMLRVDQDQEDVLVQMSKQMSSLGGARIEQSVSGLTAVDGEEQEQEQEVEDLDALWLVDPVAACHAIRQEAGRASKKQRTEQSRSSATTVSSVAASLTAPASLAYDIYVDADAHVLYTTIRYKAQRILFTLCLSPSMTAEALIAAHSHYVATSTTQRAQELQKTLEELHDTENASKTTETSKKSSDRLSHAKNEAVTIPSVLTPPKEAIVAATTISLPSPGALVHLAHVLNNHGLLPTVTPAATSADSVDDVNSLCHALVPVADAAPMALACTIVNEHVDAKATGPAIRLDVVTAPSVQLFTAAVCAVVSGTKSLPFSLTWALAVWRKLRK